MSQSLDCTYLPAPRGFCEIIFIFVLMSTQLFMQGPLGYTLVPLHIISKTFGQTGYADQSQMAWHIGAFSLTVGSFILIAGRLGDIYGSKKILLFGWLWSGVWSLICGFSAFSGSAIFFDTSRAFQGIGSALQLPNALAVAGRTYKPSMKKNLVFSLIAMCAPLGGVIGALIGSAFAQYAWWPWAPWTYGIGCFILGVISYFAVPEDDPSMWGGDKLTFDWLGSMLGVGGLVLLNVSFLQATIDGWQTPYVYVLLILAFGILGLFVWQEKRATHPILDMSIINMRVALTLVVIALGWSSFGIWFYYIFQFVQNERGVSPLVSALQFGPGALSGMVAPFFTAWALPRISTGWLMVLASSAFLVGSLLQATAPVHQSYWFNTFWSFVITPWGMDVSFPVGALFISDAVVPKHQGISASLVNTVINYSIVIGLGIAGTVEFYVSHGNLLKGYQSAQYSGTGLAAAGLFVSIPVAIWHRKAIEKRSNEEAQTTLEIRSSV